MKLFDKYNNYLIIINLKFWNNFKKLLNFFIKI